MTKGKVVPDNESGQEKFRRVVAQRIKPIRRYAKMIEGMPTQPSYDINSHDAQLVIDELNDLITPVLDIFAKARDGDLKAKEIKEYTGIDWDKELEDTSEDDTTGD